MTRRKFGLAAIMLTAALAACSQTVAIRTPFNPAAHEFANKRGSGRVSGEAYVRRGGATIRAAGSPVTLWPYTPYTAEIMKQFGSSVQYTNVDQRLANYVRRTQADRNGRFTFSGVSAGRYAIVTQVPVSGSQAIELVRLVTVENGQKVDVTLAN